MRRLDRAPLRTYPRLQRLLPCSRSPHATTGEPRASDLRDRVGYTVMFLRMTEKEIRKLAENTPEISRELGTIADQLHAEARDLAGHTKE